MGSIKRRLANHQLIGLDTSVFIYHLEAHPQYQPITQVILEQVQSGQCIGIVSTITVMELTVHPWRVNRPDIAREYELLLVNFPNVRLMEVTREVARRGAYLRARYNLRPADALHVGTAMVNGATVWVSNDKRLKKLGSELEVINLDDFVEGKT
jgi:predicted nucleic acid-binding protein